jgi:pimeloyl-ACP methyl ester carboxylesterase
MFFIGCKQGSMRRVEGGAAAGFGVRRYSLPPAPVASFIVRGGMACARARYDLDFARVAPVSAMSATRTPVLPIHGLGDSETPYWHSEPLAQANARARLWLVPGARHVCAGTASLAEFRARLHDWFGGN